MPESIKLREAQKSDAAELSRLFGVLGFPIEQSKIEANWDEWLNTGNRGIVAEGADGNLLGVITTHRKIVLHRSYPVGRIMLLVVDTPAQGHGVGKSLLRAAELALEEQGCKLVEITSRLQLTEAHGFYEHLGYSRTSLRLPRKSARQKDIFSSIHRRLSLCCEILAKITFVATKSLGAVQKPSTVGPRSKCRFA